MSSPYRDSLSFLSAMSDHTPKDTTKDTTNVIQQTTHELEKAVRQTAVAAKLGKPDNIEAAKVVQKLYENITRALNQEHNETEESKHSFRM